MRYIKRDLTPNGAGQVKVFYEDTKELLFVCDPYIADTIIYTWNNQKKILAGRGITDARLEVFKCVICKQNYTDPYEHVEASPDSHMAYIAHLKENNFNGVCFCENPIKYFEFMGGGFERSCEVCHYIFDQDEKRLKQKSLWDTLGKPTNNGSRDTMAKDPQILSASFTSGASL